MKSIVNISNRGSNIENQTENKKICIVPSLLESHRYKPKKVGTGVRYKPKKVGTGESQIQAQEGRHWRVIDTSPRR